MSFLQAYGLWVVIILLLVAAAVITPGYLKPSKLMLLLRQAAPLGIVALGQLFVILVSGIDLSVGQVMSMTSVIASGIIMGERKQDPACNRCCGRVGGCFGLYEWDHHSQAESRAFCHDPCHDGHHSGIPLELL